MAFHMMCKWRGILVMHVLLVAPALILPRSHAALGDSVLRTPGLPGGAWYDADAPISKIDNDDGDALADPLVAAIDELTSAARPRAAEVVRAVYEAAGEDLPDASSFKRSDLGEGLGDKQGSASTNQGLSSLLEKASGTTALQQLSSLDSLESVLQKSKSRKVGESNRVPQPPVVDLDHSADFVPTVLIQLPASQTLPTAAAVQGTLRRLRGEQSHLKRKLDRDMEVAEITSNDADLRKGLKEAKQLQQLDHKLSAEKRQARRVEQIQEGHVPAGDFLTAKASLEQKVEARVWREHIRRLQLVEKDARMKAYRAKMHSARTLREFHYGKKRLTRDDVERADVKADMAVDNAKAAGIAMKAALIKDTGDTAFEPKHFSRSVESLVNSTLSPTAEDHHIDNAVSPNEDLLGNDRTLPLSRGAAQKLASKTAARAEGALSNALLTDRSFDKAATAAKVALAYEQSADKLDAQSILPIMKKLKDAKESATHAMVDAIHAGTQDAYIKLRTAIAARKDAEASLEDAKMKQQVKKRLKSVRGLEQDPSVMVTKRLAEDSDATFYRDVKKAERAYQHAADSARESDISSAGSLVSKEEKSAKESQDVSLELVKLRTTVTAKHVSEAQKEAEEAINAEHQGLRDYHVARRHAWSSVTAKEAAEVAADHASDALRDANEKLADEEATAQEKQERYRRLNSEAEVSRRQSVAARAIAQTSKDKMQRREKTIAKLRRETAKDVASELRRLEIEVETLEKTGHKRLADEAIAASNIRQDKRFLARESNRELDAQIAKVKRQSTNSLAESMQKLVKGESEKLQAEISSPGDSKSQFDTHSQNLDARLAALRSKAEREVQSKIKQLHGKVEVPQHEQTGQQSSSQKGLSKMFRQVKDMRNANNKREERLRDKKYIVQNTYKTARRLKVMQSVSDKPLAVAEAELRQIITVEKDEEEKLANNTFAGQSDKAKLDAKFTTARMAVDLAKKAMKRASTKSTLKRAEAKMEAAKKLSSDAKASKLESKKAEIDRKMEKIKSASKRKVSRLQQAADAAMDALHSLQKSDLQKAKTKVLEAQIRHDRWMLQKMQEDVDETSEAAEHEKNKFEEISERLDKAHYEYSKAKKIADAEKSVAQRAKEASQQMQRRYDTAGKVTHLADQDYKERKHDLTSLRREAARMETQLKEKRKDLAVQEAAEQTAILSSSRSDDMFP